MRTVNFGPLCITTEDAYFDVRVTHVNAKSQAHKSTASILKKHEEDKKREYNERVLEVEYL